MEIRKSERKRSKMRLGIQGPSGSGKTYSALLLANGLSTDWSKIVVIDTENGSADLYAHLGSYNVLPLRKPFTPEKYIEAIETVEKAGMEVIIIDSASHCWEELLLIHGNMPGNSFANWSKITPRHNAFIQKILQSPCHVIATIRAKQDYVLNERNGKFIPEKVGLKGIQRDGVDFEFSLMFDIDIKHNVTASKDRTGLYMDKPPFVISQSTGKRILKWCGGGADLEAIKKEIKAAKSVEDLRNIYLKYPEYQEEIKPLCEIEKKAIQTLDALQATEDLNQ